MSRKKWRKLVKKLQRKKRRQKSAKERAQLPDSEEDFTKDSELSELQRFAQERQHQEAEEAWLRRELLSQQHFRLVLAQRAEQEAEQDALRKQQEEELNKREAERQRLHEQKQHRANLVAAEFERTMERLEEYLANVNEIAAPTELRRCVDTKPGQKLCEFYERTNCCRFGAPCCFNHRRPLLSSIILIRHFFTHPLMEQSCHKEYDAGESLLELSERDLRTHYDAFFADVVPEMERFGKMLNFRVASNVLPHLRGHVFVEYTEERSALKAFISLQGRYYATKRLNVEFSNLRTWRGAVCGLSITRKCAKGQHCSYLHLFRNPDNKYNTLLEYTKSVGTSTTTGRTKTTTSTRSSTQTPVATPTPSLSWNGTPRNDTTRHDWRWSESPEPELVPFSSNDRKLSPKRNSMPKENTAKPSSERSTTPTSRIRSERSRPKSEDKEKYDYKQERDIRRRTSSQTEKKSPHTVEKSAESFQTF